MSLPKFVQIEAAVMPDPRWRTDQAKRGAPKAAHPCIIVLGLLDEHGAPWVYDEILGFRKLTVNTENSNAP